MQKLSVKGLALAMGILWGAGILFAGIAAANGWGVAVVNMIGSFYIGYEPTIPGAFIGLAWAFVDGLVGGAVLAWLYNVLSGAK